MLNDLITRYPQLDGCKTSIEAAAKMIIDCYEGNGKLLLCGNGGSAADCDHIVGELMKGFLKKRRLDAKQRDAMHSRCPQIDDKTLDSLQAALPAISLPSIAALNSAFCNDAEPSLIYAQSVLALGNENDLLIAISTSGNSTNVLNAAVVAKSLGIKTVALCGKSGGKLRGVCDISICVPEEQTYKAQELHMPIYHYLCANTEEHFFD